MDCGADDGGKIQVSLLRRHDSMKQAVGVASGVLTSTLPPLTSLAFL
jgi:hypothetical protein